VRDFKLLRIRDHQLAVFIFLAGLVLIRHSPREAGISRAYLFRRPPQTRPTVKSLQTLPGYMSQETTVPFEKFLSSHRIKHSNFLAVDIFRSYHFPES
jgi:hypothetical protein